MERGSQEAIRERSELARHLRGSIFPADAAAVIECAVEEHAPDSLLSGLRGLPADQLFLNVEAVWEALGGERERRAPDDPQAEQSRTLDASTLEGFRPEAGAKPVEPAEPVTDIEPTRSFGFRFDLVHRLAGAPFLVTPATAAVVVDRAHDLLTTRFGPWRVVTRLTNIERVTPTGPYQAIKTVGPPRLSLADRGLTFATNDQRGLCIQFRSPVRGIDPLGLVHHPAITVTVDDVSRLAAVLSH